MPFVIACGECFFCNRSLFAACEETNSGRGAIINKKSARPGAGLFGYSHLYGGYSGGQAEYARVPQANAGPILIPDFLGDDQVLFLSDILPTGYQGGTQCPYLQWDQGSYIWCGTCRVDERTMCAIPWG